MENHKDPSVMKVALNVDSTDKFPVENHSLVMKKALNVDSTSIFTVESTRSLQL